MGTKRAVARRIGSLDLDGAFAEAEARSVAGQACEIWCQRDDSGRPVAYRVVSSQKGRAPSRPWEWIATFVAAGSQTATEPSAPGLGIGPTRGRVRRLARSSPFDRAVTLRDPKVLYGHALSRARPSPSCRRRGPW